MPLASKCQNAMSWPFGAPAEAVADLELLFVDPVRGAVDGRRAAVRGQPRDLSAREVLDPEIVGLDVGDARSVGGELREHERGFGLVRAELPELARGDVEDPVVAARVLAPDLARVREDQELLAVGGPGVLLRIQRRLAGGRHERRGRHQDAAIAGRRVVANDVLASRRRWRPRARRSCRPSRLRATGTARTSSPCRPPGCRSGRAGRRARRAPAGESGSARAARAGQGGSEDRVRAGAGSGEASSFPRRRGGLSAARVYISERRRK